MYVCMCSSPLLATIYNLEGCGVNHQCVDVSVKHVLVKYFTFREAMR